MKHETRYLRVADLEVRELPGGVRQFAGYAIRYNEWSENLGGFVERCAPGLADGSLSAGDDVRHLINHNPDLVLGRSKSGTTRLSSDAVGLRVETDLPDTSYARDLAVSVARGDVDQMSFGFRVVPMADGSDGDSWDWKTSPPQRTLRNIELSDVSTVTFPAYPTTTGEVRSLVRSHTGRALGPALVAWDPAEGMCDYMSDVDCSLQCGVGEWAYCSDVTTDGKSALVVVCGPESWQAYVCAVELDDNGEPFASPMDTWTAVEMQYVAIDAERALRTVKALAHETRASDATGPDSAHHIQGIADALDTASSHIAALVGAAGLSDGTSGGETPAEDVLLEENSRDVAAESRDEGSILSALMYDI